MCMYIYINTFKLQHLFHGATVSIPRTWYMAVPKKTKENKKYIGRDISSFFPKVGI